MVPNPRSSAIVTLPPTAGVLTRRVIAYLLDLLFIALCVGLAGTIAMTLTVLTLGLMHGLFGIVALMPILYSTFTIGGRHGATWGMRLMSIGYRREDDGGFPTLPQAFAVTLLFYISVALTGSLILLIALITTRHRTLHDLLSGLVMVRTDDSVWVG